MKITELFESIKNSSKSTGKKQILKENINDLVEDIFEYAYNNHIFHVSKLDLNKTGDLTIEYVWSEYRVILDRCESQELRGSDAKKTIKDILESVTAEDQEILYGVLNHNLKIGMSQDSFHKVVGTPEKKFKVSLAKNIKDVKNINPTDGTFYASRKLDGVRCIGQVELFEDGTTSDVVFMSRQNKEFLTLDKIKPALKKFVKLLKTPGKYMFDGECCILDEKGDEHFDWVMKEIKRKNHTIENPCYNIFDILSEDEFYGVEDSLIFEERTNRLNNAYKDTDKDITKYIHILKQELITSQDDMNRWSEYVKDGGWEGFMLRKNNIYKSGRTTDLIKVKKFQDAEYRVIDTINGVVTYNEDGQKSFNVCSSIIIEHKGNKVSVGSGISKEQRLRWFDHSDEIIGKLITVQYFEETQDKKTGNYSLRFPVLKFVYNNDRDI